MDISTQHARIGRRKLLTAGVSLLTASGIPKAGQAQSPAAKRSTVRDRFWIFAVPPNTDFERFKRRSVMTPVESAFYFGVPNVIMVQASTSESKYGRFEPPFEQYAVALKTLKRVAWSVVGSGGFSAEGETRQVLELAGKTPNFVGVMLDDFFGTPKNWKRAMWTTEELADFRRKLQQTGKKLDIFVTLYTSQMDLPLQGYFDLIDVITLWTGDMANLEAHLKKVEKLAPKLRKMAGIYVADYGTGKSRPIEEIKLQCETSLKWLRDGRIEGIIFLGNTAMDFDFESVEWTRNWIREVADAEL
jgi:hypothetical protein